MVIDIDRITSDISQIIDVDSIDGIMLTGSCATGECTDRSDIDIMLFSRLINIPSFESIRKNDRTYQLIYFPLSKSYSILQESLYKRDFLTISLIQKGIVLKETSDNDLEKLKKFVSDNLKSTLTLKENDIQWLHYLINKNIEDLKNSKSQDEKMFCAIEIIRTSARLKTSRQNFSGKHLGCLVRSASVPSLSDIFKEYILSMDETIFIDSVKEQICGIYTPYFTNHYSFSSNIESDILIIFFPQHNLHNNGISDILMSISGLTSFANYVFTQGRGEIMEEGVYMLLQPFKLGFNSLRNAVDEYFEKNVKGLMAQNIRMTYPYYSWVSENYFQLGEKYFDILIKCFSEISRETFRILLPANGNTNILVGIYFLRLYLQNIHIPEKRNIKDLIIKKYLGEITDPNNIFTIYQKHKIAELIPSFFANQIRDIDFEEIEDFKYLTVYLEDLLTEINGLPRIQDVGIDNSIDTCFHINIIDHVLSIFHLKPYEKYIVVNNTWGGR